jgi:hypothetical protein
MFRLTAQLPLSAIRRLRSQTPRCSPFQSCQQEILVTGFSDATLQAWATLHPLAPYYSLLVTDFDNILPFTQLEFRIAPTAIVGVSDPGLCCLFTSAGQTAAQVSTQLQSQINAWAQNFGRYFRNLRSLRAGPVTGNGNEFMIYMPWGMLLTADITNTGITSAAGLPGVDNPLFFTIHGKRRDVHVVRNGSQNYYYSQFAAEGGDD